MKSNHTERIGKALTAAVLGVAIVLLAAVGASNTAMAQEVVSQVTHVGASAETSSFTAVPVQNLIVAQSFVLDESYRSAWSKERPEVKQGTVIVVRADKSLLRPRQSEMPILFVNDRPIEQTNFGYESGRVVAIVAGEVDLQSARIYFGTPGTAESVDAATGRAELEAAVAAGARAFPEARVAKALERGGEPVRVANRGALYAKVVAKFIDRFSPQEAERAAMYRGFDPANR